jgi:Raf kinase inhibitor-like YbhB/YbcL family protein
MQLGRPVVRRGLVASAALAVILTACNDDGREMRPPVLPPPPTTTTPPNTVPAGEGSQGAIITAPSTSTLPASFQLVTAWPNGAQIPARYTCDDANVAPAISWTAVPVDAVEIAVSMVDLDANFVHWVMFAISPTRTALGEGEVPPGAIQWTNDFGDKRYGGPCPPGSDTHTYLFTVHALNQQVEVADDASATEVVDLLNQTSILESSVSGTYARSG